MQERAKEFKLVGNKTTRSYVLNDTQIPKRIAYIHRTYLQSINDAKSVQKMQQHGQYAVRQTSDQISMASAPVLLAGRADEISPELVTLRR